MTLELDFSEPWLESMFEYATPSGVPQVFPVSIAGRTYPVIDTSFEPYRRDAFRHRSIQAQKQGIDTNNVPGEGTVNTEGLWRRSAVDWHFGAGQPFQDRKGSEDARFSVSKGVNPWMQWQLELLNDTKLVYTANVTQVLQVGKYAYVLDKTNQYLKFSSDLITWSSAVTGLGSAMQNMATDGYDIWISDSSGGIYTTTAGASSGSQYVTDAMSGVWYVGERLMSVAGPAVYNILTSGSAPSPLWTHPSSDFIWSSMCDGSSQIYMAGSNAGQGLPLGSVVYRSTIEATGTALTVPVQALPMEGGEYCTSLYGYLNFVFVGSNLGVRMCRTLAAYDPTGNQGDLEAGPLIPGLFPPGPVNNPVNGMVGNNRFLYFGWTNYDTVSTGLGRMDLSTFIDTQAPAFTSDIMATTQGGIISVDWCTINSSPIFCVNGHGVYTSNGAFVASGHVDSGYVNYGIADDKILMAGDFGTIEPQQGTVTMSVASDAGSNVFAFVGQQNSSANGGSPNQSVFPINQIRGEQFTVRTTLVRDPGGESPIVHRWTIKALPAITAGTTISVVLALWSVEDNRGSDTYIDPYVEKAFLENLRTTQSVFEYVEGPYSALCTVDEIDWLPHKARDAFTGGGYEGNIIVYLKTWDIGA